MTRIPNLDLGRVRGAVGAAPRGRRCGGFSLTELIVVIGIIVLFLAVAIPAFNVMSGRRSVAGAQNVLSAEVANVRMRAIAQQRHIGLLIHLDAGERVLLRRCEVVNRYRPGSQMMVDLSPEAEPVALPQGISMQFLRSSGGGGGRYAGFIDSGRAMPRVLLFAPSGRVELSPFWYRAEIGGNRTMLGELLDMNSSNLPPGGGQSPEIGFVLFDRSTFAGLFDPADSGDETAEENWLDENGTLLILSRYNGTFVQEER